MNELDMLDSSIVECEHIFLKCQQIIANKCAHILFACDLFITMREYCGSVQFKFVHSFMLVVINTIWSHTFLQYTI